MLQHRLLVGQPRLPLVMQERLDVSVLVHGDCTDVLADPVLVEARAQHEWLGVLADRLDGELARKRPR